MSVRASGPTLLVLLLLVVGAPPIHAQGIWPERAANLQELPEDFPTENLRAVMRGFSRSLGVRCSYCHVGVEGEPLSTYDFASDDNPMKDRARAMLRLLGSVNDHLGEMDPSAEPRVNMWCHTCHAGKPRPMTLQETLTQAYLEGGGETAVERFIALRSELYGGNQYDFRAPAIHDIATGLLQQGDTTTASRFLSLNVEHFPDFAQGYLTLGDVELALGRRDRAIAHYERALEIVPENETVRARLERARGGGG